MPDRGPDLRADAAPDLGPTPDLGLDQGPADTGLDVAQDLGPDLASPDAGPPGPTVCPNPPLVPPASGVCEVSAGAGSALLVRGQLLVRDRVLQNGHLLIDQGKIVCAGCDCSGAPGFAGATVVACASGVVSPGLINPHDHLTYTLNKPATTTTRYNHRHEWRLGLNGKPKVSYSSNTSNDAVHWGELRMIIGGATSTMGAGGADKLLRNLEKDTEGLSKPALFDETFPLDDSDGTLLSAGCGYPSLPSFAKVVGATAFVPHVAEGVIVQARNEFLCLSGQQVGGVDTTLKRSGFIHAVGVTATDVLDMRLGGTSLIWSPRTNISLYGFTADVVMFRNMGVPIALGTDWTVSGSMNVLRELACARLLNETYYGSVFSDLELWEMVTRNAAVATGFDAEIGRLKAGQRADVAIFDGSQRTGHAAVVQAEVTDVALVMRGGEVLYGEDAVVQALSPTGCEALAVCGRSMRVCLEREIGKTLAQLQSSVGSAAYPLFYCGVPLNEPTCVPSRPGEYDGSVSATDGDGDGIDDASDLCPTVFDPVRPMDGGKQRDEDGDGVGDACDPCPLEAGVTQCSHAPKPGDTDGDTVLDSQDNCPTIYNKVQADQDGDGDGDACDPCPKVNPGGGVCPLTIKELRDPSLAIRPVDGTPVKVQNATVIGIRTTKTNYFGFFIREGTSAFEAIFIYTGNTIPADSTGAPLAVGDVVTVEGKLTTYQGIDELAAPLTVTVTGSGLTDPVDLTTDKLQPGSASGEAQESQLVRVKNVTVALKVSGSDDFWVTDSGASCSGTDPACARVADFFYDGAVVDGKPTSTAGGTFSAITGVVNGRKSSYTLDPRGDADLVP